MATVKTAVSVRESLFKRADQLAKKLNVPRSRLFAMALEDYLDRHDTRDILRQLNEVHGQPAEEDDRRFPQAAAAALARLSEDEKW